MENIPDPKSLFDVSGKVALITGATGAFGQASAKGLAKAGAKVMLTGRTEKKLEPLAKEIQEAGYTVAYAAGHPDNEDDVKRIVQETVDLFGGIDILITAAGVNIVHPIVDFPLEEWETVMNVNVKGTWLFCKYAGQVMTAWLALYGAARHSAELSRLLRIYHARLHSNLKHALSQLHGPGKADQLAIVIAALIDGVWLRAALTDDTANRKAAIALVENYIDNQPGKA